MVTPWYPDFTVADFHTIHLLRYLVTLHFPGLPFHLHRAITKIAAVFGTTMPRMYVATTSSADHLLVSEIQVAIANPSCSVNILNFTTSVMK